MKRQIVSIVFFLLLVTPPLFAQEFLVARVLEVSPQKIELTVVSSTDPKNTMLILIVDDEKTQCDMLQGFLEKQGYKVLTALSGKEALHIFETAPVQLVLLDHRMDDMKGDEVLKKMRAASPLVRAIMITAYGDVQTAVKVMQLGADDFLEKPVALTELLGKIERIANHFDVQEDSEKITESLEHDDLPLTLIAFSQQQEGAAVTYLSHRSH